MQVLMGHKPGSKAAGSTYPQTRDEQKIKAARKMEAHLGRLVGLGEWGRSQRMC